MCALCVCVSVKRWIQQVVSFYQVSGEASPSLTPVTELPARPSAGSRGWWRLELGASVSLRPHHRSVRHLTWHHKLSALVFHRLQIPFTQTSVYLSSHQSVSESKLPSNQTHSKQCAELSQQASSVCVCVWGGVFSVGQCLSIKPF